MPLRQSQSRYEGRVTTRIVTTVSKPELAAGSPLKTTTEPVNRGAAPEPRITRSVQVGLILEHLSGTLGQENALAAVSQALASLKLDGLGELTADQAELLFSRLMAEPGLVGLAAKVTKQMVRIGAQPLAPVF